MTHIPRSLILSEATRGLFVYYTTSLLVVIGVFIGLDYVPLCREHPDSTRVKIETVAGEFGPWDGVWYRRIVRDGYSYDPNWMSNVAFFPLYPASAWSVMKLTGLHIEYATLLTSHLYLAGAFVLFAAYLRGREEPLSTSIQKHALLALGLFPTTFYLRMSYTESTFLFVAMLAMYGMQQKWRNSSIAVVIGLATASRTVGVSLLLPFAWHLWCEDRHLWRFTRRAAWLLPLSCWGLVGYMIYLWQMFDAPMAFAQTQKNWHEWAVPTEWWRIAWAHLTLEPLWQVYLSDCPCYWGNDPPRTNPLISMQFANPLFILLAWGTIVHGARRRQLTMHEVLLSIGLLAVPYFMHSYRGCCAAGGRYTSVVFPFYIVLGHWLSRCPRVGRTLIYLIFTVYLAFFSAMFVQWYWFY